MNLKIWFRKRLDPMLNAWWDFQCNERYWQIRRAFYVADFHIRLWVFNLRIKAEHTVSTSSDTWTIVRSALGSLVWALLLFFSLTGLEELFRRHFSTIHDWSVQITNLGVGLFSSSLSMTTEMYADLMGGIASVAGVFLGLYFTAISIGVGQELGGLSPRVRHLIVTERKGSLYIKLLTTLTALSFLLWGNAVALGNASYPALVFIIIFSLFIVAAFYPLGLQSFFMADPSSISMPVFQSINATLRRIENRSYNSGHPSFDKYNRTQTIFNLRLLQEIAELALKSKNRDYGQLSNLLENLYRQVLFYTNFKYLVESNSQWYSRLRHHDDLLMMDDIKGKMLEQFGHIPDPKEEPDPDWFENEALKFTEIILKDFSNRKDIQGIIELLPIIRTYIGDLAGRWQVDLALSTFNVLYKYAQPLYANPSLNFTSRLHLAEGTSILKVDIVQQSLQRVIKPDVTNEIEQLTNAVFSARSQIMTLVLPSVKSQIEDLREKLATENRIEGKILTPRWYVSQLIAKTYSEQVNQLFNKLALIQGLPESEPMGRSSYEDAAVSVFVVQSGIQVVSRLSGQEHFYASFAKGLKAYERVKDIKIVDFESGKNEEHFQNVLDKSFDELANLLLPVFKEQRDKSLPDFFGLAYYQLANELFHLLKSNKCRRFTAVYPKVLTAAFIARDRILKEYAHIDDIYAKARFSLEPIFDLMTLGSYAALYSELYSDPGLYESTLSAWKDLFQKLDIQEDKPGWLISAYKVMRNDFRTVDRASIRFSWEQEFAEVLEERNFIVRNPLYRNQREITEPNTPWLKALCSGGHDIRENLCEVFLAIYLPHLGASDNSMKQLNSDFYNETQRESKRGSDEIS